MNRRPRQRPRGSRPHQPPHRYGDGYSRHHAESPHLHHNQFRQGYSPQDAAFSNFRQRDEQSVPIGMPRNLTDHPRHRHQHNLENHPPRFRGPFIDSDPRWRQPLHDIRQRRDERLGRHEEGWPSRSRAPFQPSQNSYPDWHQQSQKVEPAFQSPDNNLPHSHHRNQSVKPPFVPPENGFSRQQTTQVSVQSTDSTPQSPAPTTPSNPPATNDDMRETPSTSQWNSNIEDRQKEIDELKIRLRETEFRCKKLEGANLIMKEDKKTAESQEDLQAALKRGDDLEQKLKDLELVVATAKSELDALKKSHESLSSRLKQCKRQYELNLDRLENECNEQRDQMKKEKDRLQFERLENRVELEKLREQLENTVSKNKELKEQRKEVTVLVRDLTSTNEKQQKTLTQQKNRIRNQAFWEKKVDAIMLSKKKWELKCASLEKEKQKVVDKNSNLSEENRELKKEAKSSARLEKVAQEWEEKAERRYQEMVKAKSEMQVLRGRVKGLKNQDTQLEKVRRLVQDLKTQLKNVQSEQKKTKKTEALLLATRKSNEAQKNLIWGELCNLSSIMLENKNMRRKLKLFERRLEDKELELNCFDEELRIKEEVFQRWWLECGQFAVYDDEEEDEFDESSEEN